MTLAPGTRLGPYEILSQIGAGGMGVVYKARDTRLDRAVAVKILSASVSSSPDARERFEREARTISQISHPHICALYERWHRCESRIPNPESRAAPVPRDGAARRRDPRRAAFERAPAARSDAPLPPRLPTRSTRRTSNGRFLAIVSETRAGEQPLTVVLHWPAELRH